MIRFSIQNFRFYKPSKKRNVTQSSRPDDHVEKPLNLCFDLFAGRSFPAELDA